MFGSMLLPNGLKRAIMFPEPLANWNTVPPAPGTHIPLSESAAWKTGCHPPNSPPASGSGFQSLAKDHLSISSPASQCSRFSLQTWLNQLSLPQGNGEYDPGGLHELYVPLMNSMNTSWPSTRGA